MIPRFSIFSTCLSEEDGEFEGTTVQLRWLGLIVEVTIARRDGARR